MSTEEIPQQDLPLHTITSKSVIIAEPDSIASDSSPGLARVESNQSYLSSSPKQHRTNSSKRLSGRLPDRSAPSLNSLSSLSSLGSRGLHEPRKLYDDGNEIDEPHAHRASYIISQVAEWLQHEKSRRASHKSKRRAARAKVRHAAEAASALADHMRREESHQGKHQHVRRDSDRSEMSIALEKLDQILAGDDEHHQDGSEAHRKRKGSLSSRKRSLRKLSKSIARRGSTCTSSEAERSDNELLVPSAEVVLDNSKTMSYSGGMTSSVTDLANHRKRAAKEKEAWQQFKTEILTLTHTLGISGWRRVALDKSNEIDVERLCGALTNAVYVVSPPKSLPTNTTSNDNSTASLAPKRPPPKLLLRIYGPQAGHLIDREDELQILRRLARKKIGPRLLGTFVNGRFEQFFYARTLTAEDLRIPETSKQIAKRMRELHDGIELLKEERDGGPFVWRNWEKCIEWCDEVMPWLDEQVLSFTASNKGKIRDWRKFGLICGTEWPVFKKTVTKYREWLNKQSGGRQTISKHLIFAHNDTQYGNLLRLEPSGESPLLLPANEHKQLVVIDFEYASANLRGYEFANHFTEWCYNYHDPTESHALNEKKYPSPSEQHRFLKAYIQHQPLKQTGSSRPTFPPRRASSSTSASLSSFMLDSRAPPAPGGYDEEERRRDEATEIEIQRLSDETRLWRAACSVKWVIWGIVQAKVPGMDEALEAKKKSQTATPTGPESANQDTIEPINDHEGKPQPSDHQTHPHLSSDPVQSLLAPPVAASHDKRPEEITKPTKTEGRDEDEEEDNKEDNEDNEDEEFDNLGFARDRALFFWGDILQLGIVSRNELPKDLLSRLKIVEY